MSHEPELLGSNAQGQIRSIVERIERLNDEIGEITEQRKEVFAEAKGNGFDVKVLRRLVRARKRDKTKALEENAIAELYALALGDITLAELV